MSDYGHCPHCGSRVRGYTTTAGFTPEPHVCMTLTTHPDQRDAEIARLREALDEMIVALRIQARLAAHFGGDIALNEGNGAAWDKAKKALANRTITPEVDHE